MTQTSNFVIKFTLALLLLTCLPFISATAQTIVTGSVIDERTNEPLPGVEVRVSSAKAITNALGVFEVRINIGAGQTALLKVVSDGFDPLEQTIKPDGSGYLDVGTLNLDPSGSIDQSITDELIPTITLNSDELGGGGVQNISGVLSSSRDAFTSAAAFVFGPARFNIRGYDAQYTTVLLNGLPMNDLETGRVFWNNWGGLNDVMRNRTNTIGLDASTFAYGGVGGASTIDTRASTQRKQLRVSYALSNRTYRNRVMATYNTGRLPSGWAVSLSASRRWADEGYVEGTFYDAYSYFLSVDKELGESSSLNLTAFGAPIRRGKISGATQEIYDLAGTNFYNANWGYQDGKKRNARVQDVHQPVVMLRHDWDINDKLKLTSTLGGKTGRTGNSALDWYEGADPRPQYYRYLPSFYGPEQGDQIAALWRTDPTVSQINWDQLYQTNYNSFATVEDANGITGNTVSGLRSQYVIEDRRTDVHMAAFNSVLEAFLSDRTTLQVGVLYNRQRTDNFKEIEDLLGGDFYLNVDRFAEFDSSGVFVQNNLDVPNQILREGDRWGYDYEYHMQNINAWAQLNVNLPRVDLFAAVSGGSNQFWRVGNLANGKFPTTSAGESAKSTFSELGLKGGATYKVDGRNYLLFNAAYQTRAPYVRDGFTSPRTRNQLVDDLTQEKVTSIEGGYLMKSPGLQIRAIGYLTQFKDQIFNRSLFLDNAIRNESGTTGGFVNYIMRDINTQHAGVELAVDVKITPALRASAVAAIGQYIYTSRPQATFYLDQLAEEVRTSTIYIDNYSVPGAPNEAYTFSLNYRAPKRYWFANVNFNYFGGTWLDFYPERRTITAVSNVNGDPDFIQNVVNPDSPEWNAIIDQERTPAAFTMDMFAGKSWKVFDDYFIYLNVGVSNVLDKQDFRTGGYEQFRFDFEGKDANRFPPNYFYSFGRNYFINLTFRY